MTHVAKIASGAVTVGGAPEGWDAKLVADRVAKGARSAIHIARDDARAAAMAEALALFAPGLPVIPLPHGTACPMTGSRPIRRSRPRAWRR